MHGHVATKLECMYGSRKIKNMIYARDFSLQCLRKAWASYLAANSIIFFALRQAGAVGSDTARHTDARRPSGPDSGERHFERTFFNDTFSKLQHS